MNLILQKVIKIWLFILVLTQFSLHVNAQSVKISGSVKNAEDQSPMPSVTIKVAGGGATVTDGQGRFVIRAPSNGTLLFSFTGFSTQEVKINGRTNIDVVLAASQSDLDEVVVVGYGTMKKSQITGSVSTLDHKVLENGTRANPASALAGTIPGLRVQQTSGRPGAVPTIILRGGTNLDGSGSPLVIVDGLLRSGFSDINQQDIESISVLKDASATAIYGARANNGVVLITTKRGKSGSATISLNTNIGIGNINNPYQFLNAKDYLYWSRKAIQVSGLYDASRLSQLNSTNPFGTGNLYKDANGNYLDGNKTSAAVWSPMFLDNQNRELLSQGWKTMLDPATGKELIYKDFDYASQVLRSSSITQDYNVSATAGNDKGSYYAGLGFYNEEGLPINTYYKRLTFVLNGDYKIKPWLKSISGLNFATANWRDPINGEANYFGRALGAPPTMRGRNMNGDLLVGRSWQDGNVLVNDDKFIRKNNSEKMTMSQGFETSFMENLKMQASGNWFYEQHYIEAFNKDFLQSPGNINRTRNSSANYNKELSQTYNAILNYNETFAQKHGFSAMIGTEYYDKYVQGLNASGDGAPTDDFMDLSFTNQEANRRNIDTYHARQRILRFFGRLNYDYDNKYLLTYTFSRDGYSKLINNRWGNFPGISLGWNIANEDFFVKYKNIVSSLKLKASYGVNGNVDYGDDDLGVQFASYGLQGAYSTARYDGAVGFGLSSLPAANLFWEKSSTIGYGIEATIFDKLSVVLDVYNRKTTGKISSLVLPISHGFNNITTNNGTVENKGVELALNYKIFKNKDWDVDFSYNTAYNKNTILKLPFNGLENNRQGGFQVYDPKAGKVIWVGGFQEGQDPNVAYAYVAEGIYRTQADLDKDANRVDLNGYRRLLGIEKYDKEANKNQFYPIALGDVRWKDLDNNDTIDFRDRQYIGRTVPRWTGGFTAAARWKQFSLNARFSYALGFMQYDGPRAWFLGNKQGTFNTVEEVKDTYTPENINAQYPTYYWADQLFKNNYRESTLLYKKGDYLAINQIVLSYSMPTQWASKIKAQSLTFSITGQNLGYISQSTLFSPESKSQVDSGGTGFPLPRTVIFGLNMIF